MTVYGILHAYLTTKEMGEWLDNINYSGDDGLTHRLHSNNETYVLSIDYFLWGETKQGFNYWSNIYDRISFKVKVVGTLKPQYLIRQHKMV